MLKKRQKLKVLKVTKLRGGGMDMGSAASQAKSAAMAGSSGNVSRGPNRGNGGVNTPTAPKSLPQGGGRNPMAQFTTLPPGYKTYPEASKDLTKQRKTTRAQISPSTTFRVRAGAAFAGAVANAMLPGSGPFVGQKILRDADKHGYWERDKIQQAKATRDAEDQARRREDTPLVCPDGSMPPCTDTTKSISVANTKTEPYPIKINFNKGGLSGGVRSGPPPKRGPNPQGLKLSLIHI